MASNACLKFAWLICFGLAIGGALGTRKELRLVDSISKVGLQAPSPTPSTANAASSNDREAVHNLLKTLCKQPGINCYDLMTSFTGKNCCLNSSSVEVFLDHEPQSTATKNMVHLAQMIRRGTITKYDYNNDEENMEHYGQTTPPAYNMSSIPNSLPLFLSYGGLDELSDVTDVKHLLDSLKSHDGDQLTTQYVKNYAHADFVMAVNAKQVVYNPLMDFFKLQ
ncbi:putative triacylglycerol lipase 2 [Cocos nucifera]|uniref:Putative triacylglycerol lipase 2 n=1 Tax=Cocos nucifera TaxID=13894 RepID=A0A8K0IPZ2_COCNU|nr:putative triacylglycerol lipase 2 [Cocos nucifera]